MKTVLIAAAIVITLTAPSVARMGLTAGSEASGEPFNSSFQGSRGAQAMAQGRLPRAQVSSSASISANSEGLLFTPASSGMDGGNRK